MHSDSRSQERPLLTPELAELLYEKAETVLSRLIERYLPQNRRGFVGDDADEAPGTSAPDPYRVLGLKLTATAADIRRRVRELAKVYHPDLQSGDAEKMAEINDAAAALLRKPQPKAT